MAKVQFQVDGFDANQASIFNDDVIFDGNVDANSISVGGVDIFTAIPNTDQIIIAMQVFG
jgi:hypothetical protein